MSEAELITDIDDHGYMMYVRILETTSFYKKGEVLDLLPEIAKKLVTTGIAEHVSFEVYKKNQLEILKKQIEKGIKKQKRTERQQSRLGLKLTNYIDNAEYFYEEQPYFYDKSGIFWFWDKQNNKYVEKDDTDVMNLLEDALGFDGQTVTSGIKRDYIEAFKRVGRKNIPKDAPEKWVQFKDKAYSLESGAIYDVTPDYFFTNPIPHELGSKTDTPIIDKLFKDWVGESNIKVLYQLIAYSCYKGYPIQLLFCLYGSGRNGKSCFQRLLNRFIGLDNVCSTEMDILLDSRFEAYKLYKKLICTMGETNFGVLNKTSLLKKLTGGDMIGFEKKNKTPFDDINYAKIIISSNSLPTSADTSEGFYRRWLIIDFPNEFPEGKDILKSIPEVEYSNLARKITVILKELLNVGMFDGQGNIKERKLKYQSVSNPLPIFLEKYCIKTDFSYVSYNKLYTAYVNYLGMKKKRRVKMREFKVALEDEGYWVERSTKKTDQDTYKNGHWIEGLELKADWQQMRMENV